MSSGKKASRIKSRSSQLPVYKDRDKPTHVRVKDLLARMPDAALAVQGYRVCSGIVVGILFGICTLLLITYQLTIQMADELAARRSPSVGIA